MSQQVLLRCLQAMQSLDSSLLPIRACNTVCSCHTLCLQQSKLVQ
jgi:hypothetical protein